MTQTREIQCDVCGRTETFTGKPSGWGSLLTVTQTGNVQRDDVCISCMARLHGWENPVMAGTNGRRVRETA